MKNWELLYLDVSELLKVNLPPFLTYHNWEHTEHVVLMSQYIARKENVSESDILLIKTAALFHDSGFIYTTSDGHERESIRFAKEKLPYYGYSNKEIECIAGMISATEIPQKPNTKNEGILADADLEYLGTDCFENIANNLYLELKHSDPNLTLDEWNTIQINFLQLHRYHTPFCIAERTPIKEKNIEKLMEQKEKKEAI
nr:HD domain-containing protein [uncultured Flavobacterium sp.]